MRFYKVGVLHERARDTAAFAAPDISYSSVTMYNTSRSMGVLSVLGTDLVGSFERFFPDGIEGVPPEHADLIYVHLFAPTGKCPPDLPCSEFDDSVLGVYADDLFRFTERVYLNRTTGTAPSQDAVESGYTLPIAPTVVYNEMRQAWLLQAQAE